MGGLQACGVAAAAHDAAKRLERQRQHAGVKLVGCAALHAAGCGGTRRVHRVGGEGSAAQGAVHGRCLCQVVNGAEQAD